MIPVCVGSGVLKVVVTQGPTFPSPNYTIGANDNDPTSDNTLLCGVGSRISNPIRVLMPTVSTILAHVKITITNCGPDLDLAFVNIPVVQFVSFYTNTSTASFSPFALNSFFTSLFFKK